MKACPESIGNARVVCYTPIDHRHRFTGECRRIVCGELMEAIAGLAICYSSGEDAFYLFGCDSEWQAISDTWHQTLEEAQQQAEFEYEGVGATWVLAGQAMHQIAVPPHGLAISTSPLG
jgi:hypothetical protein